MIPEQLLEKARAKGSDKDFTAYVRQWPSILTNDYGEWVNGDGRSVFAHVERVSHGSGRGIKAEYSGVPLTQEQHANTHQYGESHYAPSHWWEGQAVMMLSRWINGTTIPQLPEKRSKASYIIESSNHMNAFKEMLAPYFRNEKATPVEIIIQTGKKRTEKQNRGMWAAVIGGLVEFYSDNPEALAKDVVEYVLLYKPSSIFVHELMKGLCNNNQSTATLKKPQHCNYFDKIAERFVEKHSHEVQLPINDNGYNEFY